MLNRGKTKQSEKASAYATISEGIRKRIVSGKLPPGALLPSHRELAAEYNVAIGTIQNAVALLVSDGTLTTQANRGLFVSIPNGTSAGQPDVPTGRRGSLLRRPAHIVAISGYVPDPKLALDLPQEGIAYPARRADVPKGVIIDAIERTAQEAGGSMAYCGMLGSSYTSPEYVLRAVKEMQAQGADAIVLVFIGEPDIVSAIGRHIDTEATPVIDVGFEDRWSPLPYVYSDSRDAGYQAARHILASGCEDLLFFAPFDYPWRTQRQRGVEDAVASFGLSGDAFREARGTGNSSESYRVLEFSYDFAREILKDGRCFQGVVGANDEAALGYIAAAAERGWKPGRDFIIIGCDDQHEAATAGLSTLRPPMERLGREAAHLALESIGTRQRTARVCLHSELIVRESSREPQIALASAQ